MGRGEIWAIAVHVAMIEIIVERGAVRRFLSESICFGENRHFAVVPQLLCLLLGILVLNGSRIFSDNSGIFTGDGHDSWKGVIGILDLHALFHVPHRGHWQW